jgi:hypothetical protein
MQIYNTLISKELDLSKWELVSGIKLEDGFEMLSENATEKLMKKVREITDNFKQDLLNLSYYYDLRIKGIVISKIVPYGKYEKYVKIIYDIYYSYEHLYDGDNHSTLSEIKSDGSRNSINVTLEEFNNFYVNKIQY